MSEQWSFPHGRGQGEGWRAEKNRLCIRYCRNHYHVPIFVLCMMLWLMCVPCFKDILQSNLVHHQALIQWPHQIYSLLLCRELLPSWEPRNLHFLLDPDARQ